LKAPFTVAGTVKLMGTNPLIHITADDILKDYTEIMSDGKKANDSNISNLWN